MSIIAVSGTAQRDLAPELARVQVSVSFEHADAAPAATAAIALHERLVSDAKAFVDAGEASEWRATQVVTGPVHTWKNSVEIVKQRAASRLTVEFVDFDALGIWLGALAATRGASVGWTSWALTRETRERVEAELRLEAAQDAVVRAGAYASAFTSVPVAPRLVALYESGLRPTGGSADAAGGSAFAAPMLAGTPRGAAAPTFALEPEDITVRVSLSADFEVDVAFG